MTWNAGDRVVVRDRLWRVRTATAVAGHHVILELEGDDDQPQRQLTVIAPPEEIERLPNQDVEFDLGSLDAFANWASAHRILDATLVRETGLLSGARFGRVALEAYQLAPVLRVLAKPRPSLLIADDVGLGKTIEAGLILLELMARGRADRVLIVTPPGLMDQWRDELQEKFGLSFVILDNAAGVSRVQSQLPAGVSPWDVLPRVITSVDFVKKETVRHRALRKHWDLVIVDEAHALAESGTPDHPYRTQRTRLGLALRQAARGLVLLTATPHNGYWHSFRSLLELVEPTQATFQGDRVAVCRRIETARIRRMKAQIKRRLPDGREEPVFPAREVRGIPVALSPEEAALLRKVASYCSRTARQAEGSQDAELIGFAMQIVKKRALSSRAALAKTIEHRLSALKKEEEREEPPDPADLRDLQANLPLDETSAERTAVRILKSAIPADERRRSSEVRALEGIRRALKKLPSTDPKLEALIAEAQRVLADDPHEKLIVFTEYLDTLGAIEHRIAAEPNLADRYVILRGGLTRSQRLRRQERFAHPDVRLLLATDAASEGLNLQHCCRRVIHMELPWNPNRMEQRNGRVDRYGQTRPPIIRYLYYPNSPEESVLDQLVAKIQQMARDQISTPDLLGMLAGERRIEEGLVSLDPEAADVEQRKASLVRLFEDRTADFVRQVQPLLAAASADLEEHQRLLECLDTAERLLPDEHELEHAVLHTLGPRAAVPHPSWDGVFAIHVPWHLRGPGVAPHYPAVTFRRSVAVQHRAEAVGFVTPLHPLVRALATDARRRLLQVYAGERRLPPRRLAARTVPATEAPSVLFTFLGRIRGECGFLEEQILAIRVAADGTVLGDPPDNVQHLDLVTDAGEVERAELERWFAHRFDQLREIAKREAEQWLERRAECLREKRKQQAAELLRDLEVDVADRLREIQDEERRARGLIEDTGQQRLFADHESVRSFDARREAVRTHEKERRREIAAFAQVHPPEPPLPLGALFLVPARKAR